MPQFSFRNAFLTCGKRLWPFCWSLQQPVYTLTWGTASAPQTLFASSLHLLIRKHEANLNMAKIRYIFFWQVAAVLLFPSLLAGERLWREQSCFSSPSCPCCRAAASSSSATKESFVKLLGSDANEQLAAALWAPPCFCPSWQCLTLDMGILTFLKWSMDIFVILLPWDKSSIIALRELHSYTL